MIDSDGGRCNAGRAGLVYNSPKHRGSLDHIPFQGFCETSRWGITPGPSPVTDRKLYGDL